MNKEITIDGKKYILNMKRAEELGICVEKFNFDNVETGDVYSNKFTDVLVVEVINDVYDNEQRYQILGCVGLEPWSDFDGLISKKKLCEFLTDGEYEFVRNINKHVVTLIKDKGSAIRKSKKS